MEQIKINELISLIKNTKTDNELKRILSNYHESDISKVFPYLSDNERNRIYKVLDEETISDVFSYLDNPEIYLTTIPDEKAADIIEQMDTDDAVDVLETLEDKKRTQIIDLMDEEVVTEINLITSYDDEMIGSKMTTNYIAINKNTTVKNAMKTLIQEASENDNVSIIYFIKDDKTYYGAMELRDLIIARENDELDTLIKQSYPSICANEKVVNCIELLKDYALSSIPVVDDDNKLIGVITSDDIIEVVQEELVDDYTKLAALTGEENFNEPILRGAKKRMPWLLILVILDMLVSMLISNFEELVKVVPIIVSFQSLILDMAGNAGTQSLAMTIRLLSNENTTNKDIRKQIFKETRIGIINGFVIGVLSMVVVMGFLYIFSKQNTDLLIKVGIITGVSMFSAMTIASFGGSFIPTIFKKMKVDPAVASGPFITTINDLLAILIYYGLAFLLFVK